MLQLHLSHVFVAFIGCITASSISSNTKKINMLDKLKLDISVQLCNASIIMLMGSRRHISNQP